MTNKFKIFLLILFISSYSSFSNDIRFVPGSNVYVKIFLFYFPIGRVYDSYFTKHENTVSANLDIKFDDIINEPINEQEKERLFNTDLSFNIREIPVGSTGRFNLPVTMRCNRKIVRKNINFTIVTKQNIMVLRGDTDIYLGEFNDSEIYKNRASWKYPFHFDLRYQLP